MGRIAGEHRYTRRRNCRAMAWSAESRRSPGGSDSRQLSADKLGVFKSAMMRRASASRSVHTIPGVAGHRQDGERPGGKEMMYGTPAMRFLMRNRARSQLGWYLERTVSHASHVAQRRVLPVRWGARLSARQGRGRLRARRWRRFPPDRSAATPSGAIRVTSAQPPLMKKKRSRRRAGVLGDERGRRALFGRLEMQEHRAQLSGAPKSVMSIPTDWLSVWLERGPDADCLKKRLGRGRERNRPAVESAATRLVRGMRSTMAMPRKASGADFASPSASASPTKLPPPITRSNLACSTGPVTTLG